MKNDVIWFDKPILSSVPPVWEYFDNLIVAGAKAQKIKMFIGKICHCRLVMVMEVLLLQVSLE